eukprot:scaffold38698_cov57-Phaeocystis_antarctica.AAC.3
MNWITRGESFTVSSRRRLPGLPRPGGPARCALEKIAGSGVRRPATFLRAYRTGDGGYCFSPKQPWKPKNAINPSKKLVPSGDDAFAFLSGMLSRPPETSATDEVRGSDEGPDAAICSAKVSAVAACKALPLAGPDKG